MTRNSKPTAFWLRKQEAAREWERRELLFALEHTAGNRTQAALFLGLDRANFSRLCRKHGIKGETK